MDIEKILPIIFLILWSIATTAASKKKRQAARNRTQDIPAQTTERPPRQKPESPADRKRPAPIHDLKRTLQDVFQELEEAVRQDLPSTPVPRRKAEEPSSRRHLKEKKDRERKQKLSIPEGKEPPRRPDEGRKPAAEPKAVVHKPQPALTDIRTPSSKELRRAIIWSEIIDKPVSLRPRS